MTTCLVDHPLAYHDASHLISLQSTSCVHVGDSDGTPSNALTPRTTSQHTSSTRQTPLPRGRRRSVIGRGARADIYQSIQKAEQEQSRYESFIERIEALEKSSEEMISEEHIASENCDETKVLMAAVEEQNKIYYTTLEEAKRAHDLINSRLNELSAVESSLENIIQERGWKPEIHDEPLEGRDVSEGSIFFNELPSMLKTIDEITMTKDFDEMSEVSISSDRHDLSIHENAISSPMFLQIEKGAVINCDLTVDTTVLSVDSASFSIEDGDFMYSKPENNFTSSPLPEACFRDSEMDLHLHDDEDLHVSELLEDARFIRCNEQHLIISPAPFIKPLFSNHPEEDPEEDIFCLGGPKSRNTEDQCEFCVVQ